MPLIELNQKNINGLDFISIQMTFSTADMEQRPTIADNYNQPQKTEPIVEPSVTWLAIHGDYFELKNKALESAIPFTEESKLFEIINLVGEP